MNSLEEEYELDEREETLKEDNFPRVGYAGSSTMYKNFGLNEHGIITKKHNPLGKNNKYCIVLSTEGRGMLEFIDEFFDFADEYDIRPLTEEDKAKRSYKSWLTKTGEELFTV